MGWSPESKVTVSAFSFSLYTQVDDHVCNVIMILCHIIYVLTSAAFSNYEYQQRNWFMMYCKEQKYQNPFRTTPLLSATLTALQKPKIKIPWEDAYDWCLYDTRTRVTVGNQPEGPTSDRIN